jgi:hypothetical protein
MQISIPNFPEMKIGMHTERQKKNVVNKEWRREGIKSKRT